MAVYLNSRRQFLQLMGITSILIVLENWGRQSLAQNPFGENSFQPLLHVEAWVARHGISADEYQSEFNKYTSQGYRPVVVSGYRGMSINGTENRDKKKILKNQPFSHVYT